MSAGRRPRLVRTGALLLVLLLVGAATLRFLPGSPWHSDAAAGIVGGDGGQAGTPGPGPEPTPTSTLRPLPFQATGVDLDLDGWYAWSVLDLRTGELTGSPNMAETSTTASMIKAWVVADQLRRTDRAGERPSDSELHDLSLIIRESNDELTHELWDTLGGTDSITRLIRTCELTDSSASDDTSGAVPGSPPATPPASATASPTAPPPARSGRSGCWRRCARCTASATSASAMRPRRRSAPGSPSRTAAVERTERDGEDEIHVNCLAVARRVDHGRDAALPQGPRLRVRHGGLREDHRSPAGRLEQHIRLAS